MNLEEAKKLLDEPAIDATGRIKGPSLGDLIQDVPKEEEKVDVITEPVEEEETPTGGKKVRIPASRLKTLTSEIETLRPLAQLVPTLQERIAALEAQPKTGDELPPEWVEAFGDTDESRKVFQTQLKAMETIAERNFRKIEESRSAEERAREERTQAIEHSFDTQMTELEETLGRTLTDNQKSEIMDIVGEYSPQDGGQYVGYISIEKAHDIWKKSQSIGQGKQEMAKVAGMQSSGATSQNISTEAPKWGDWRKRFG